MSEPMSGSNVVHVVVPAGIDDPRRPSGGNVYDRHVCDALRTLGWSVREHAVAGGWPCPSATDLADLAAEVRSVADDALVLLDGLIASAAAGVLVPEAERLRLVVLVHLPLGHDPARRADERAVLTAAEAVVTTSRWTRTWLLDTYEDDGFGSDGRRLDGFTHDRVQVAVPGVDAVHPAPGTPHGGEFICVAALTPSKGHDVLLSALEAIADLAWRCTCVGSLELDPAFVERLSRAAEQAGIGDRLSFAGPLTRAALGAAYARADLAVLASRNETYGMVVTEALGYGLPVIATQVGGVPEALGQAAAAASPGVLVPPDDAAALAAQLRSWLTDAGRRERLRAHARQRRSNLRSWDDTARDVADVLARVSGSRLNRSRLGHVSVGRGQ